MVKIRLQRRGRRKKPFYHIVIADARAPRDGRFIEKVGTYNPMTAPATIDLDREKAFDWLMKGAQPTDTVRVILRANGVMYRKHLARGVQKGALTQEEADAKLAEWLEKKEAGLSARFAETERLRAEERRKIAGTAPKIETPEEVEAAAAATAEAEAATAEPIADAVEDRDVDVADSPSESAPDGQDAAAAAEALEDAASPAAENAEGAVNKGDTDLQSAVDVADNNAAPAPEPQAVVDADAVENAATEPALAEATVTTDEGVASTEHQVAADGKTDVPA